MRYPTLLFLLLLPAICMSQRYTMRYVDTKTDASFRGLSVAHDNTVWVSGSKGWVGRSPKYGTEWKFQQVPGYEKCDFRTIFAFDANNAIIANAGSPAYVLRTSDGGTSWKRVYENTDTAAFIDGVAFWDSYRTKRGLLHGDPINGRMLLLYTRNAGKSWKERKRHAPHLSEGEASFAASGTAIHCMLQSAVVVATGGKVANVYLSRSKGRRWRSIPTPMLAGKASTGIYSIMPGAAAWHWLIAGGDHKNDTASTANFFYTHNKGKQWHAPTTTRGYRECLTQIDTERPAKRSRTRLIFAVGPAGIDTSADNGITWKPYSDEKGFHVARPSTDHNLIYLAGSNGKLAVMRTTE